MGGGVGGRFGGIGIGPRDNTTCLFTNSEPNVATFYQDQLVTEESVEFPSGAELVSIFRKNITPKVVVSKLTLQNPFLRSNRLFGLVKLFPLIF